MLPDRTSGGPYCAPCLAFGDCEHCEGGDCACDHAEEMMCDSPIGSLHEDRAEIRRLAAEVERWRGLCEMVDAHYSGSLDHQPAYVRAIRAGLDEETR